MFLLKSDDITTPRIWENVITLAMKQHATQTNLISNSTKKFQGRKLFTFVLILIVFHENPLNGHRMARQNMFDNLPTEVVRLMGETAAHVERPPLAFTPSWREEGECIIESDNHD